MAKNSWRALAALTLSLVLGLARAQDSDYYDDPPDRAARLSYLSGDVAMQPAGEEEWAPAILNRPLTTADKLWTERDARAEIEVGPAVVRLDGETGFSFLNVDDDTIQMRVTAGVIYVNVRALQGNDHVEIDTPNIALSVLRPGSYRVEVNDAGDSTTVKISEGEAEVDGPGQNVVVHAQQSATFRGENDLVADWGSLGSPDEFDRWNLERDRRDERRASSRSAEYVSPDVTGYQDLDDYGSWSSEPEYGYVWRPTRVVAGWSPYRFGRWVWISPWGWTWIDDAPWGYAPFHYGRWAHVRNHWCWVPGPRHVRAVYAPALVGWVGSPGVSVSVSFGSGVGWFPLGPREVYVPGRRFSHRYVERVNVSNTVIVNRTYLNEVYVNGGRNVAYRNRNVPGGFTAVSRDTFLRAGHTGDRRVRLDDRDLARGTVTTAPQLQPGRESRLGGQPRVNVRVPPRTVVDRQVVVKRDPPPAATRFTRSRGNDPDLARRPGERFSTRPPDRQPDRGAPGRGRVDRPVAVNPQPNEPELRTLPDRSRDDRPPKQRDMRGDDRSFERQRESRPQAQQDVEQRSPRDDRDRQQQPQWRDTRDAQQREVQEREARDQQQRQIQEREARDQQQRQFQEREVREQQQRQFQEREARDQQQRQLQQQQERERFQRQQDSERQRSDERQRFEQQRQQQERQNQDRQRFEQQRQQQERQQQEQRQQSERERSNSRPEPRQDNKPRHPRNDDDNPRPQRE